MTSSADVVCLIVWFLGESTRMTKLVGRALSDLGPWGLGPIDQTRDSGGV